MREADWQRQVVELAGIGGWTSYHTHDSRRSARGFPDLVLVRPPRLIFAELKGSDTQVTHEQHRWLRLLGACPGVEVHLWRPWDLDEVSSLLLRRT